MNSKVSVITTLYNYANYISDCILSFQSQTLKDIELVIVDDASSDNPEKVISNFSNDSRIKYIKLDLNGGYSKAKNIGIQSCSSDVIVMLDADDMLTDNSLEIRYNELRKGYDFIHGPVLDLRDGKKKKSKLWNQWLSSKKDASCYKFVHAQSVMLKKELHSKIGLYDEKLRCKSDREMWARIFNHNFKIGWVEEPVAIYRIHPSQMHKSKEKLQINDRLQKEVLEKIKYRATNLSDVKML